MTACSRSSRTSGAARAEAALGTGERDGGRADAGREKVGAPGGRPRRKRRSREEVSQALVDAAAELFAERPSGRVTVREIAARADVNPALVHRYFGTKQNLMRAAMEKSQRAIAANLSEMTDVRRDLGLLYRATVGEKEFVAVLARASLDGVLPEFPAGYPTMGGLVERIEAELRHRAGRSPRPPRRGRLPELADARLRPLRRLRAAGHRPG